MKNPIYIVLFLSVSLVSCFAPRTIWNEPVKETEIGKYRISYGEYLYSPNSIIYLRKSGYRLQKKNVFGNYKDINITRWEILDSTNCKINFYRSNTLKFKIDLCKITINKK